MSNELNNEARHRELFNEYIANNNVGAKITSTVINRELGGRIIEALIRLEKGELIEKRLRERIKKRGFCLIENESDGRLLLGQKKGGQVLEVGLVEDFYDIIKKFHGQMHAGINATQNQIKQYRTCVSREAIEHFIKYCTPCNLRRPQPPSTTTSSLTNTLKSRTTSTAPKVNPIESKQFWEHCQLDFINMQNEEYDGYKWIAHIMCHFTKYHIIWPIKELTVSEIYSGLARYAFAYFGLPKILHCHVSVEFKNQLMAQLAGRWPGTCNILCSGGAHHMQTLGLIERGNQTLMNTLAKMKLDKNTKNWPSLLPKLMYNLNTNYTRAINKTPFNAVFNIEPNRDGLIIEVNGLSERETKILQENLDNDDIGMQEEIED